MRQTISGIRGIVGEDLNLPDIMGFCGSFATLVRSKRCVIGRDTRPSGRMVADSAKAALMGAGIDVYDLGVAPTPAVFREARKYGAGLAVTSSHNPLEWNGLKFILDGRGINEQELPQILNRRDAATSRTGSEHGIESSYIEDAVKITGTSSARMTVDVGGGAALEYAPRMLEGMGCDVSVINGTPDECTRGPDPTADPLGSLIASAGGGTGVAFDLDGDRLVLVRGGRKRSPDATLAVGAAAALDRGCRDFVLSIDTSMAVENLIVEGGGRARRSKVGEANVTDMMVRKGAQAGGEGSSGGFILEEFNHCRDGMLTAGLVAATAEAELDRILQYAESYSQARGRVAADASQHQAIMESMLERMGPEFAEVSTIDGIRGSDGDSWVLIRPSNTEHAIRVSAESGDTGRAREMLGRWIGEVERWRG